MFDKLKALQPFLEKGLKVIESSKRDLMVLTVVSGTCFSAGRLSTPPPEENKFCSVHIGKFNTCEGEKKSLNKQLDTIRKQLMEIEDEYAEFTRKLIDKKDKECLKKIGEKTEEVKEQFLNFKCNQCKRRGKCK